MADFELLQACHEWTQAGPESNFNEEVPILRDTTYSECQEMLRLRGLQSSAQPAAGGVGTMIAKAPNNIKVPNFLKSESFVVISIFILAPLLIIGFYTRWTFKWQPLPPPSPKDKAK